MGLLIDIGVAKTNKYASRESGDTVEIVERAAGGLTIVMADGQGSGRAAKTLSQTAAAQAVSAVKNGARDAAAAALVNDSLLAARYGQVSASLCLLSFDGKSGEIVATRFGDGAMLALQFGTPSAVPERPPAGLYAGAEPASGQWPLEPGFLGLMCTDGIVNAGRKSGETLDLSAFLSSLDDQPAQQSADRLLELAIARDGGRPGDDMAVAIARIVEWDGPQPIRRMAVRVEFP